MAATAHYIFNSTTSMASPIILWVAIYVSGYMLSAGFKTIDHRVFQRVFVQILVWGGLTAAVIYRLDIWYFPGDVLSWYHAFLGISTTAFFWLRGAMRASRQITYKSVCNQFDLGFGMFLSLYVIDMMVAVKAGVETGNRFSFFMLLCFFLAGPLAIFLAIHPEKASDGFPPGPRGHGVLFAGAVLVVILCLSGVFILNPMLTSAAEMGGDLIKQAAGPLSPYCIAVLKFLFAPRSMSAKPSGLTDQSGSPPPGGNAVIPDAGLFSTVMVYSLAAVFIMGMAVLLLFLFYLIYKRLAAESPTDHRSGMKQSWTDWLKKMVMAAFLFAGNMLSFRKKNRTAQQGFVFLMKWGKRSGLPKWSSETPDEYAGRLGRSFSELKTEIELISSLFQKEKFGLIQPEPLKIREMASARQKMTHPSFWFPRLRCRFSRRAVSSAGTL